MIIQYRLKMYCLLIIRFCMCYYCQVQDASQAEVAKVVPTPNNGYTELVRLHRTKVGDT